MYGRGEVIPMHRSGHMLCMTCIDAWPIHVLCLQVFDVLHALYLDYSFCTFPPS